MSAFSIILNIITILLVFIVCYIGYIIYKTREDKNMTATEVFNLLLTDPSSITHSYMTESSLGPIGDFSSYDWEQVETMKILK